MESNLSILKHTSKIYHSNEKSNIPEFETLSQKTLYSTISGEPFDEMNIINSWSQVIFDISTLPRTDHCSFIYNNELYLFGGFEIGKGMIDSFVKMNLNETVKKWEKVSPKNEGPVQVKSCSGVLVNSSFYLFGGYDSTGIQTNSFYELELSSLVWKKLSNNLSFSSFLPSISGHIMIYHHESNSILIHGGTSNKSLNNNIYQYDIPNEKWSILIENTPSARHSHSGDISKNGKYLFISGGCDNEGKLIETSYVISLNIFSSTLEIKTKKINRRDEILERSGHKIRCVSNNKFVLFGGKKGNLQEMNDLIFIYIKELDKALDKDSHIEIDLNLEIIHPNLIEYEKQINNKTVLRLSEVHKGKRTKENFSISNLSLSSLPKLKPRKNKKEQEKQKLFDDFLFESPDFKYMHNSIVYKTDNTNVFLFNQEAKLLTYKKESLKLDSTGVLPTPRDGHSCDIYNNKLVIFGGDRNKYSFNDLFIFDIEMGNNNV